MTVKRLFVLAILGGVLSRSAASTCGPEEFQCGSGECIGKELRCTNPDYYFLQKIPDCADWSNIDPGLCSSFPTINLRVGEQVSAAIWYTRELRHMTTGLMFFLCDGPQNCGFMDITYVTDPGLYYMACASGDVIGSCADSGVQRGAGTHRFSHIPEFVEIVAERSADKLTVWWKMGPEQRAWTFVPANASSLMIRPSTWFRDIEVTWGDVTEACRGPNDFRCANGECVTIFDRCQSGRIYCADGSDRDPEYCSAFPSASLEVGQRRLVTVQWGANNSYTNVMFVMCDGPMNCGAIATQGSTPSGALFYKARHRCTVFWSQQDAGREVWPNGTIFFPREMDKLVFEVELRAGNLTVSLPGASTHPGAWVTVPAGATSLMVRPGTWYQDMAVEWGGKSHESIDITERRVLIE